MRIYSSKNSKVGSMSVKSIIITNALIFITVFFFQNCDSPVNEDALNSSGTPVALNNFPYDFKMDYAAFLSCPKGPNNTKGWSFKVGALDDRGVSGLTLSRDFLETNSTKSKAKREAIIKNSSSGQSILVLGLRASTGNASIKLGDSGYSNFLIDFISNDTILPKVAPLNTGEFVNFFEDMAFDTVNDLDGPGNGGTEFHGNRFQTTLPPLPDTLDSSTNVNEVYNDHIKDKLAFTFHSSLEEGSALKDGKDSLIQKFMNVNLVGYQMKNTIFNNAIATPAVSFGDTRNRLNYALTNCFSLNVRDQNNLTSGCQIRIDSENTDSLQDTATIRAIIDPNFDEWWISIYKVGSGENTSIRGCIIPKAKKLCGGANAGISQITICTPEPAN